MISTYRNHIKDITYIFEWGIKMVMSPKSPINKVGFNHLQWCSMVCFFFFGYIQGNFLMCFFNHQIHGGKPNPFPIFPWNSMIYWPTIWLFNSLPWYRWPIETDGYRLPSYKPPFMVGIFHGYVSHNQMVYEIPVSRDKPAKSCSITVYVPGLKHRY
jgi:hypothetical protein